MSELSEKPPNPTNNESNAKNYENAKWVKNCHMSEYPRSQNLRRCLKHLKHLNVSNAYHIKSIIQSLTTQTAPMPILTRGQVWTLLNIYLQYHRKFLHHILLGHLNLLNVSEMFPKITVSKKKISNASKMFQPSQQQ